MPGVELKTEQPEAPRDSGLCTAGGLSEVVGQLPAPAGDGPPEDRVRRPFGGDVILSGLGEHLLGCSRIYSVGSASVRGPESSRTTSLNPFHPE